MNEKNSLKLIHRQFNMPKCQALLHATVLGLALFAIACWAYNFIALNVFSKSSAAFDIKLDFFVYLLQNKPLWLTALIIFMGLNMYIYYLIFRLRKTTTTAYSFSIVVLLIQTAIVCNLMSIY